MFSIWCEWDMGFSDAYTTREKAEQAIQGVDWSEVGFDNADAVKEAGLVEIKKLTVD